MSKWKRDTRNDDDYVTVYLGELKEPLNQYLFYQTPGTSREQVAKQLISIGLAGSNLDATSLAQIAQVKAEASKYAYARLAEFFKQLSQELGIK